MPMAASRSRPRARATISERLWWGEPPPSPGARQRSQEAVMPVYCSRIARRVRLAENVNGIAGLKVAPGEGHVGVQREIGDRERADGVEGPSGETFHQTQERLALRA